ncbi:RagB/SusD family nutrient uptake outer membrane protein [uncultured Draconibacterium sp.]|uniref:RagB/SusD family nutrient uptake outer membrane protein n=1 Tax=uncultured Draconibacterium sp. TaxID=1573823 RepID=UPI003216EEA3
MKDTLKYFLLALVVGLGACTDDFLESEPTEFISTDRMAEMGGQNPEIFNGTIRGLYTLMYQTGTGGSTGHDDFGQKGFDIYSDLLSGDMVLGGYNYGWYKDIATLASTVDYRDVDNYRAWRYYYRIIRAANTIIDGLGGNDVVLDTDNEKWQMGQAKTMRAYSYFYLANFYLTEYDVNSAALPLYLSLEDKNLGLSTGADVWNQIKSDLEQSVVLLDGYSREGIHGVNKDVANGLLAYTYLTMGDYANAASTAQEVIDNGYAIVPFDYVVGGSAIPRNAFSYYNGEGADWIWGMDLTLDQGLDLVSWWGQVDLFTYSYAWAGDPKTMDMGLYNSIPETDLRKYWFLDPWAEGLNYPIYKFYDEGRSIGGQREVTSDYVYMRIEEMYLIKAEAEAFDNKDTEAKITLSSLVVERNADPSYLDALSGQDLKDEIYKQWRVEMWGEGKSYLAMKRNHATVVREGHIDHDGVAIPSNDDRLTFDIPYQEIQDNPNISRN